MKKIKVLLVCALAFSFAAQAFALFENEKIINALENGSVKVGMSKDEVVGAIGYPPEGKPKQDALFYRFAQSKVTASGKEESWTYQMGATSEGVRSVTIKMVDGKVTEWNEWLDVQK